MIRRFVFDRLQGASWLLISQRDHARLALELAQDWSTPLVTPATVEQELLVTIAHHDDGWLDWEAAPQADPRTGRPRQFTEMPLEQSLVIWQRSIDVCRQYGELPGWLVAGHFSALLRHLNAWQASHHPHARIVTEFLARQDRYRAAWLEQWQSADPAQHTLATAERALRWLQFFDYFSLWLCCQPRLDPAALSSVEPACLRLLPRNQAAIGIEPWPWRKLSRTFSVPGTLVPATSYTSSTLPVLTEPGYLLHWELTPAGAFLRV